jgi:hypothetical protein
MQSCTSTTCLARAQMDAASLPHEEAISLLMFHFSFAKLDDRVCRE